MRRFRIELERDIYNEQLQFLIKKRENGKSYRAKIVWEEFSMDPSVKRGVDDCTLTLNQDEHSGFIQNLLEELGHLGYIKEDATVKGLQAELKATDRHLEDMRTLVFKER